MNIKEIVDKIIKEADIQAGNYSAEERVSDVNDIYLRYVEKALQIASAVPISNAETTTETFTIVSGANTLTRTIPDVPIRRVDFQHDGSDRFSSVPYDTARFASGVNFGNFRFFADQKRIFIEDGYVGDIRVTYERGAVTLFTLADYNLVSGWPSPDWLPTTFHPLLWLDLAHRAARKYKKGRAAYLKEERDELRLLFDNRYGRESAHHDLSFLTDEAEEGNNR